jgi:hypothetical protein
MSKESYARGFCKAAEAAEVDPVALAKYAAEVAKDTDAGIGYRMDNGSELKSGRYVPTNPTSYIGRLNARHPGDGKGIEHPYIPHSAVYSPISEKSRRVSRTDLVGARYWQSHLNASRFFPKESVPYKRIKDNLSRAGEENYKSYLETGDTKERTEPNLQGIENLKLTPEQKNLLLQMQNTMASRGVPRTGNIA